MKDFEFDDIPPTAIPVASSRSRTWVLAAALLVSVALIACVGVFIALDQPSTETSKPEEPRTAQGTTVTPARTSRNAVTMTANSVVATALTVSEPVVTESRSPRSRSEALAPDKQAKWDRALAILTQADRIELLALQPDRPREELLRESFQDWKVLGKVILRREQDRTLVVATARSFSGGSGSKCFNPRHGIRAVAGKETVELVICFECSWVKVFVEPGDISLALYTSKDGDALNEILMSAGIRRPHRLSEFETD